MWDSATGETIAVQKGHTGNVNAVEFSLQSDTLVSASDDRTLRFYRLLVRPPLGGAPFEWPFWYNPVVHTHLDSVRSEPMTSSGRSRRRGR